MKNLKMLFCIVVFSVIGFFGCDDSASSNEPDEKTSVDSSSSICKDCDDESSSSDKKIESSAEKDVESSDDAETGKSSSSKGKGTSSSSSQKNVNISLGGEIRICEENEQKVVISEIDTGYVTCRNNQWVVDSIVEVVKPKVYPNMDSVFGSEYVHGTFTDDRDKKVYKTANIYYDYDGVSTITVMAQNLNYAEITIDSTRKVFDDSKVEKRCYKDDPWYCDNYFGALYTWSEAMGLPKVCDSVGVEENPKCNIDLSKKVQGVCPTGWHVMTETEWKHMATSNGYSAVWSVLSKAVWNYELVSEVQNSRGLSVLPKGDEYPSNQLASFWLPKEASETSGGSIHLALKDVEIGKDMKIGFFNIRCVQDEGDTVLR